jgi:hypothetical protein
MEDTPSNLQLQALRRAADGFVQALGRRALLPRTARVEAVVLCPEAEPVFLFERALRRAWPAAAGRLPLGEVIWALEPDGGAGLEVRAFDGGGRLLLRRRYDRTGAGAAAAG